MEQLLISGRDAEQALMGQFQSRSEQPQQRAIPKPDTMPEAENVEIKPI
jgi:hypothetical protein